jgi:hypothetical protein
VQLEIVNARERHEQNRESFQIPQVDALIEIQSGDFVQIIVEDLDGEFPGERFWVKVTQHANFKIKGTVDNDLLFFAEQYPRHKQIEFKISSVVKIIKM